MILTGPKIKEEAAKGNIILKPFTNRFTNPNSYDFRLGKTIKVYKNKTLDAKLPNETKTIMIPTSGLVLQPNTLYLGHTVEKIGSTKYVPIIRGKSSTGRLGLFVHITSELIDIGFVGQLTLMLHAVQPVKIYPGMRIGQVTFWKTLGPVKLYQGKYQGSIGPNSSQVYKDF